MNKENGKDVPTVTDSENFLAEMYISVNNYSVAALSQESEPKTRT